MTEERTTPLRAADDRRYAHSWLGRQVPAGAHPSDQGFRRFSGALARYSHAEELRAYQLHMTDTGVTPSVYNARITALRFFFSMTCGREEMKRYMQFRTEPRKLPAVLSAEEVSELLTVAPGPGLKYRAALSISYGAGLRASEVCNLTTGDIDSDRMLIHVVQGNLLFGSLGNLFFFREGQIELIKALGLRPKPVTVMPRKLVLKLAPLFRLSARTSLARSRFTDRSSAGSSGVISRPFSISNFIPEPEQSGNPHTAQSSRFYCPIRRSTDATSSLACASRSLPAASTVVRR